MIQEYGTAFMETSAKTGLNVDLAFMAIARCVRIHNIFVISPVPLGNNTI